MIITNNASYTRTYMVLPVGNTKFMLKHNIMLIRYQKLCIVYKNSVLIGCINCGMIATEYTGRFPEYNAKWDKHLICGYSSSPLHNIPFYKKDTNSYTIYGFAVTHYVCDTHYGGKLNNSQYNN